MDPLSGQAVSPRPTHGQDVAAQTETTHNMVALVPKIQFVRTTPNLLWGKSSAMQRSVRDAFGKFRRLDPTRRSPRLSTNAMRHTCPSGANWLHAQISPCSTPPTTTARRRVRGLLSHRHHLALLLKTRPQDRRQHLRSSAASALVLLHLLMSNLERRQQQPPRSTPRASPMARTVTHQGLSIRPSIPPNLPSDTTACRSILALARTCQPTISTARARVLANRYLPGTLFTALTRTNTRPHTLLRAVANTTPSSPAPMLVRPTEITNLSTTFRSLGRR